MSIGHPNPEAWLRELDGELSLPERRALEEHLRQCALCRAERERWRARAAQAAEALGVLDLRVDERQRRDAWARMLQRRRRSPALPVRLRWVAVLLGALLGAAVLSPPLRAWVQARWTALVDTVREVWDRNREAPTLTSRPMAPSPAVGLRAEADLPLTADGWVQLQFAQPASEARLEIVRGERTRLQVWGAVDVPLQIAGDRVEVRNPAAGAVRYRVVLGPTAVGLRWRIGAGPWRTVAAPGAGARVEALR